MTGKDKAIRSAASVHEVSGAMDAKQVQNMIEKACGAKSTVVDASSECLFLTKRDDMLSVELTVWNSWVLSVVVWGWASRCHRELSHAFSGFRPDTAAF